LGRKSAQMGNQCPTANFIDHDRNSVSFNQKLTISQLDEQCVHDAVTGPAEDRHASPILDERCPGELIPAVRVVPFVECASLGVEERGYILGLVDIRISCRTRP
jgi:hypothetical protein